MNFKLNPILLIFYLFSFGCNKSKVGKCASDIVYTPDIRVEIGEKLSGLDTLFLSDTIVNYKPYFRIAGSDAQSAIHLKWSITNSNQVFNIPSFSLTFDESYTGKLLWVTLEYEIAPSESNCLSQTYRDTLTRKFLVACGDSSRAAALHATWHKPKFLGSWNGFFEDESSKSFTIAIVDFGEDPLPKDDIDYYGKRIFNMPEGCGGPVNATPGNFGCGGMDVRPSSYAPGLEQSSFTGFYISTTTAGDCCPSMRLIGIVNNSTPDQITLNYENLKTGAKRKFLGKRTT